MRQNSRRDRDDSNPKHMGNTFPSPGLCAFATLPDPYKTAFRLGNAQHLPGQFLPAHTDWFLQIVLLPFMLMYAAPILTLGPWLLIQAMREPSSYLEFFLRVQAVAQTPRQIAFTILLLVLVVVLLGYCTWQAWDLAQSFYRTWQVSQMRQKGDYGYGLVLLSHAITGRLVNNFGWRHNCLWLPRTAIAHIVWQEMREEGPKRTHWVYRTRICYISDTGEKHWLTLKGDTVRVELGAPIAMRDRDLFDTLRHWWEQAPTEV